MSKSLLDILNASEELVSLSKSVKSDKISPDEVAEPKEKAGDDNNTDNEPKKVNNKTENNVDELTEEEKKALESGEYDYESDEEEGDIEKSDEPSNETENNENEEIHEDEALAKSVSNIITAQAKGLKELGDLAKSVSELKESMINKDKLIKSLQDEIALLKSEPVGRKSVGSVGYLEKSFGVSSGLGLSKSEKIETMSKSEKAEILSNALIKGDTSITPLDVLNAEQGIISDAAARVLAKSVK